MPSNLYTIGKDFPEAVANLLTAHGFCKKKTLWFRFFGENIIQFIAITKKGFSRVIECSSDPLFVPMSPEIPDPPAFMKRAGDDLPAMEFYNVMSMHGNRLGMYPLDQRLLLMTTDPAIADQFDDFIYRAFDETVLPILDRMDTVKAHIEGRKKLNYLSAVSTLLCEPYDYDLTRRHLNTYYELFYLGELDACAAQILRYREAAIKDIEYREIEGRCPGRFESAKQYRSAAFEDIYLDVTGNDAAAMQKKLRDAFEYNKRLIVSSLHVGQDAELVFPGE